MLCKSLGGPLTKKFEDTCFSVLEKRKPFPLSEAAALELLGMTATSAPSERVFGHAGEVYSEKRAKLGVRIFGILMLVRMNTHLGT